MKRIVYLLRHCEPDFPEGKHLCLGTKTDLSLGKTGRQQASVLASCFEGLSFETIYCSKLKRSIETAEGLSAGRWNIAKIDGIEEMNCGEWDGLTFDEIQSKYSELYELRKEDRALPPPGGETCEAAAGRAMDAMNKILIRTQGDIIIVAHSGVNRAVISSILGIPMKDSHTLKQPYGCINVLESKEDYWRVNAVGCLPNDVPGPEQCRRLWEEYQTPDEVQKHCIAVRDQAMKMAECLSLQGIYINYDILEAAALLHDLCRIEQEHEKKAAEILREHGWLRLAAIVAQHHEREPGDGFDETDILYLADKYIQGTTFVHLQQRFEDSLKKCKTAKAKEAHERRFCQAIEIEKKFLQTAGTEKI